MTDGKRGASRDVCRFHSRSPISDRVLLRERFVEGADPQRCLANDVLSLSHVFISHARYFTPHGDATGAVGRAQSQTHSPFSLCDGFALAASITRHDTHKHTRAPEKHARFCGRPTKRRSNDSAAPKTAEERRNCRHGAAQRTRSHSAPGEEKQAAAVQALGPPRAALP